jgi:hypothetical protein
LTGFINTSGTGTLDWKKGNWNVTPQSDKNHGDIMLTDSHACKNMINLQESLMRPDPSLKGVKNNIQRQVVDCLEKMTSYISKSGEKITTLLQSHVVLSQKKLELYSAKNKVQSDYILLKSLKSLLDLNVILQKISIGRQRK